MRWWWVWIILIFGLMTVLVWRQWPEQQPVLSMCDVGQGDGLIVTQGFSQLVMDVGSQGAGILPCLSQVMPFWDKQIEVLVLTHTDSDHAGALEEVLARYGVGVVVTNQQSVADITRVVRGRTRVLTTWAGQVWRWGKVRAQVVWPEQKSFMREDNQNSLVVRMELSPKESIWMAADVDEQVERALLASGSIIPTTILKVAHHGSGSATSEPFLAALRPSQAWISVGKDNRYGHPAKEIIERLCNLGVSVKRTDEMGLTRLSTRVN